MSFTATVWPIISAVTKAALFIGAENNAWHSINNQQQIFLTEYLSKQSECINFKDQELRAWASTDHKALNDLLASENFSIRLDPFGPGGFGVVSILDIAFKWRYPGVKTEITAQDGNWYSAVKLDKSVTLYDSGNHSVIKMVTRSQDTVFISIADKPLEGFELIKRVKELKAGCTHYTDDVVAIFPMLDLDQLVDISWLLKMRIEPATFGTCKYQISQAKQQTKFKMNEFGARVRSAVALGLEVTCFPGLRRPTLVVIDKPFYIWIERPGLSHPIFAGYITEADWKEPKDLDEN